MGFERLKQMPAPEGRSVMAMTGHTSFQNLNARPQIREGGPQVKCAMALTSIIDNAGHLATDCYTDQSFRVHLPQGAMRLCLVDHSRPEHPP